MGAQFLDQHRIGPQLLPLQCRQGGEQELNRARQAQAFAYRPDHLQLQLAHLQCRALPGLAVGGAVRSQERISGAYLRAPLQANDPRIQQRWKIQPLTGLGRCWYSADHQNEPMRLRIFCNSCSGKRSGHSTSPGSRQSGYSVQLGG